MTTTMSPETIIVTRHPALLEYLIETGTAPVGAHVITHATPEDVAGKRVIGVLPHRLSALAASVVEIPMDIPPELRGVELTLEQVREYAGEPVEYVVRTRSTIEGVRNALAPCENIARFGGTEWAAADVRERVADVLSVL